MTVILTDDQQNALDAINKFLVDPIERVFVLSGYSGTGKTTLVKTLLDQLPAYLNTIKLINPRALKYDIQLTATTNKAAENFSQATNKEVLTIHSFLGLRVESNYVTNTSKLVPVKGIPKENFILCIDEASYIDSQLLSWIFKLTKDCKIIFIGDPAQLTSFTAKSAPVFSANFTGATLNKVVRQSEGNPIIELASLFRNAVNTGEFFAFKPDGVIIQHLDRDTFEDTIIKEFGRKDWKYQDSKVLAWTNKCVDVFNHAIRDSVKGDPYFQKGDYAVCNKYISSNRKSIKTDQLVRITDISDSYTEHGVLGNMITIDNSNNFFFPKSLQAKNDLIKSARANGNYKVVEIADNQWIDLRAAYSCTINKAQGSTFNTVFIDLDDVKKCNCSNTLARMLYVAVSRPRSKLYLTGDII